MARDLFYHGPNAVFDEDKIAMRSRYYPVRQYNKDNAAKYSDDFFFLADARFYNIYNLHCYQGNK